MWNRRPLGGLEGIRVGGNLKCMVKTREPFLFALGEAQTGWGEADGLSGVDAEAAVTSLRRSQPPARARITTSDAVLRRTREAAHPWAARRAAPTVDDILMARSACWQTREAARWGEGRLWSRGTCDTVHRAELRSGCAGGAGGREGAGCVAFVGVGELRRFGGNGKGSRSGRVLDYGDGHELSVRVARFKHASLLSSTRPLDAARMAPQRALESNLWSGVYVSEAAYERRGGMVAGGKVGVIQVSRGLLCAQGGACGGLGTCASGWRRADHTERGWSRRADRYSQWSPVGAGLRGQRAEKHWKLRRGPRRWRIQGRAQGALAGVRVAVVTAVAGAVRVIASWPSTATSGQESRLTNHTHPANPDPYVPKPFDDATRGQRAGLCPAHPSTTRLEELHGAINRSFEARRHDDAIAPMKRIFRLIAMELHLPTAERIEECKTLLNYADTVRRNAGENFAENEPVLSQTEEDVRKLLVELDGA
ncbi:hypothetical protein AURDEDRAFT_126804 [Auricularia subglabra TFB-10046 SS5]|nr:hypothetical protein AURDEDRAFT_126804 [Auricularia subglabra TFB-10046 SS5]